MEFTVGAVLEGKVKSITSFGAFIALPEGRTGLVHISEVANVYVNDVRQFLTEGQDVKVMVIGMDNGKINLSMKRLEPRPPRGGHGDPHMGRGEPRMSRGEPHVSRGGEPHTARGDRPYGSSNGGQHRNAQRTQQPAAPKTSDQVFEEKLKAFMSESDSKISSLREYTDHRTRSRKR